MGALASKGAGIYYVLGTILFTVFGQVILKWRITQYGELPHDTQNKVVFLLKLFIDPFIFLGLVSALVAAFFWMGAMAKLDLSYAYPFMSLSFVLVFLLSIWLFREPVTAHKLIGLLLIISGVIVTGKSL